MGILSCVLWYHHKYVRRYTLDENKVEGRTACRLQKAGI